MNIEWTNPKIYDQVTRANNSKNCPNCGAPIASERCPYCGSLFVDFACIDMDAPFYMKLKRNGQIHIMKVRLRSMNIHQEPMCLYADDCIVASVNSPAEITIELVETW